MDFTDEHRREAAALRAAEPWFGAAHDAYEAVLAGNSHVHAIYGADRISERHRHRYEVNIHYKGALEKEGLLFTGMSPDGALPEIVELGHAATGMTLDRVAVAGPTRRSR